MKNKMIIYTGLNIKQRISIRRRQWKLQRAALRRNKRIQYIWHKEWQGIHFRKVAYGLSLIYDWYLWLGFLEIRKWHELKPGDIERYNAQ